MQCFQPITITIPGTLTGHMQVPCGKCMGCRIAKRKEWSVRILHELSTSKYKGTFLTLTYADEYLPKNNSLHKKDLQDFWKRLRRHLDVETNFEHILIKNFNVIKYKLSKVKLTTKIRYYACGEYSDPPKNRPHYHAILFCLDSFDLEPYKDYQKGGKTILRSKILDKIWTYGLNSIGTVTSDSAQYVAGYIEKKLTGELAEKEYKQKGVIAPFSTMSQGIGGKFVDINGHQIRENLDITVRGTHVGIPRYYKNKLKIDPEQIYNKGQNKRDEITNQMDYVLNTQGVIALVNLRRDIASYRYAALKSRYQSKKRTLHNSTRLEEPGYGRGQGEGRGLPPTGTDKKP